MIKASDLNAVIWKVLKHKFEVILNSFLQSNPMSKVHILVRKSGRLFCVVDWSMVAPVYDSAWKPDEDHGDIFQLDNETITKPSRQLYVQS